MWLYLSWVIGEVWKEFCSSRNEFALLFYIGQWLADLESKLKIQRNKLLQMRFLVLSYIWSRVPIRNPKNRCLYYTIFYVKMIKFKF